LNKPTWVGMGVLVVCPYQPVLKIVDWLGREYLATMGTRYSTIMA